MHFIWTYGHPEMPILTNQVTYKAIGCYVRESQLYSTIIQLRSSVRANHMGTQVMIRDIRHKTSELAPYLLKLDKELFPQPNFQYSASSYKLQN